MTDYFVRKTGLDTNDGLSAGAAFLTIDKAANTVAAGDTVYVGAGVYRELVTMDTSGTSGSLITYIADVSGANALDPGLVVISAYTNEESTAARASCWNPNGKEFITVRGFVMTGGTNAVVDDALVAGDRGYEQVTFEDCVLIGGHLAVTGRAVRLDFNAGASPATTGLLFRRCGFQGMTYLQYNENATAEVDIKAQFLSCIWHGHPGSASNALFVWDRSSASSFHVAGVEITNCLFFGPITAIWVQDVTPATPTNKITVRNTVFVRSNIALHKNTANDGLIDSDYNTLLAAVTTYINVTAGANDHANNRDPGLWGGIADRPLYRFLGFSPWSPWEPIYLHDGVDNYDHNVIGTGSTAAPAFDLYNEARPMRGGQATTADDRGAVEARTRPQQETTTVRTGANSFLIEGAGYHDFLVPVNAQSTTVSIYGRYDSNYTGSKPILEVLNIPGVADQSDTMTGVADQWEEVTATFTPTAAGVCRVRIRSQDTSNTGKAFFDDLTVT